jgi:hypothetical protein
VSNEYFAIADCKRGHVYRIRSRNLAFGVFAPEKENGFIGIRTKFGSRYLFTEHHWDNGPPFGTVKPIEDMGPLKDQKIRLVENFPTLCGYCGERLEYEKREGGVEKDGNTYPGEWKHLTGDGSCADPDPGSPSNRKLFRALDEIEETMKA